MYKIKSQKVVEWFAINILYVTSYYDQCTIVPAKKYIRLISKVSLKSNFENKNKNNNVRRQHGQCKQLRYQTLITSFIFCYDICQSNFYIQIYIVLHPFIPYLYFCQLKINISGQLDNSDKINVFMHLSITFVLKYLNSYVTLIVIKLLYK